MKRTFQLLAVLGALAFLTFPAKSYADSDVSLAASMGSFAPNAIELHAGETTTLHLTSTEGVHWLKSDDLGIPMTDDSPRIDRYRSRNAEKGRYVRAALPDVLRPGS